MKSIFVAVMACIAVSASAQTNYKASYERQVRMVGESGPGVEGIIEKWEEAEPDNLEAKEARINYYFFKNQSTEAVLMEQSKYMGDKALATLKDSLGRPVYLHQVTSFDDEQFALCQNYIDKCIEEYPAELLFRENKIATLIAYENESPEMAYWELRKLAELQKSSKPAWTYMGESAGEEGFLDDMQQYCFALYNIGSTDSYEYFFKLSELLSKYYPKNPDFINNMASYQLVVWKDYKKAIKLYRKALKLDPDNEVSLQNKDLAERRLAASKKKK